MAATSAPLPSGRGLASATSGRRFFTLDPIGRLLYAANLESDNIVAFRVD